MSLDTSALGTLLRQHGGSVLKVECSKGGVVVDEEVLGRRRSLRIEPSARGFRFFFCFSVCLQSNPSLPSNCTYVLDFVIVAASKNSQWTERLRVCR